MSLLLDALKKSEAQRQRGSTPTIDLTSTPSTAGPRRSGWRWLFVVLAGVLLVAAAPWLWPEVSGWMERGQAVSGDTVAEVGTPPKTAAVAASAESPGGNEAGSEPAAEPAPVAGASSPRRAVATEVSSGQTTKSEPEPPVRAVGARQVAAANNASTETPGEPEPDPRPVGRRSVESGIAPAEPPAAQPARQSVPSNPQPDRTAQAPASQAPSQAPQQPTNEPTENFIRPWDLPQAQRADFPELKLTVHFYADRPADRFVLINGERYVEGQRIGSGAQLAEIRRRGAVVEFGSYRVLIE